MALVPLATVQDLEERIGEAIEDETDTRLALAMLRAASAQVRFYGLPWVDAATAPAIAVEITISAAARGYLNPANLITERADSATLMRGDTGMADSVALVDYERQALATFKPSPKSVSVSNMSNPDVWRGGRAVKCDLSCYRQLDHYSTPIPFDCQRGCTAL